MIFTNLFLWKQLNWQKSTFSQVSGTQASILYRTVTVFIGRWWTFKSSSWPGAGGGYIYVMGLLLVETVKHLELVVLKCSTLPGAGGHYVKIFYTGLVVATNYVMGLVLVETVKHLDLVVLKCSTLPGAGGHFVKIFYTGLVVAANY